MKTRGSHIKLFFSLAGILLWVVFPHLCPAETSASGLVLHFPMDEGSGGILTDASGNKISGIIHEAKWIKMPGGAALEFDGQKSYVDCGSPA